MLTNFFIPRQKEGWLALWAVPLFRTQQVFQTCFYFSEVFRNLSHILSYCYTRLTRDLCVYWDGGVAKLTGWFGIKFQQCHRECTALFVYISATEYHMVIFD